MWPIQLPKFEVATPNRLGGDTFTRKYIVWHWHWGQGHTKCCPVPSTSRDLCTSKVWYCYIPRSYEMLPSTLYIMWPIQLQSLKLLRQKVKEMHLQEIQYLTFDLDLGVKVTRNVAQYPLHHLNYSATKFEVATSYRLVGDTSTRKYIFDLVKVTRNVAQYPLHHVTYSTTKFEVATSNGLGEDTFTWNVTGGRTDRRTDFDAKLMYPFLLKKKKTVQ